MCFLAPQIESVKTGSQSDPKSPKYQITYAGRYFCLKIEKNTMFLPTLGANGQSPVPLISFVATGRNSDVLPGLWEDSRPAKWPDRSQADAWQRRLSESEQFVEYHAAVAGAACDTAEKTIPHIR